MQDIQNTSTEKTKAQEITLFMFLAAGLVPAITLGLVIAYGFSIWMYQAVISGPPTS
ncbi:periplasmic nitrate reductase, NapE protein [Kiloniella antarctica]|uniref:Periplasmic nitrate reductase, NapE protein n=1 Tax=Kiloniella antarctica TaxID=1550907 RepID=A0ABW5BLV6_9PROT